MADALNIETYELLKPESIIPDKAVNILEKYTADIHRIFGDALNNVHRDYIKQIKKGQINKN
jgi:hypothetical protein